MKDILEFTVSTFGHLSHGVTRTGKIMWKDYFIPQAQHLKYLSERIARDALPHALLFYGPEGAGQLLHALWAVQLLYCKDPVEGMPCGKCLDCKKTSQLTHPDIHFLFPTAGADARSHQFYNDWRLSLAENPFLNGYQWVQTIASDKQGNINAGDCHVAYQNMNMQAFEGGKKVLVIWLAEYLGKDGNRLLKLIEEPPEDTHIFLITENRDQIIATVQSRCQQFYFQPYPTELISESLVRWRGLGEAEAKKIASVCEGNMNEALSLAGQSNNDFEESLGTWIKACAKYDPAERVVWAEKMHKTSKEEQKQLIRYILRVMRKAILDRAGQPYESSPLEAKMIRYLAEKISADSLYGSIEVMNDTILQIARNAHPKVTWMHCSILFRKALIGKEVEPERIY